MTPNFILRKARRDHDATMDQMGEWLGTTRQRVGQWEGGEAMPPERVNAWVKDEALPNWVRQMARDIEIAELKVEHAALGARIAQLEQAPA